MGEPWSCVLTTIPPKEGRTGRDTSGCLGRHVEAISMGQAGHTAAMFDPPQYVRWPQQALA
jgi:hypothetical protein